MITTVFETGGKWHAGIRHRDRGFRTSCGVDVDASSFPTGTGEPTCAACLRILELNPKPKVERDDPWTRMREAVKRGQDVWITCDEAKGLLAEKEARRA